jgi:DNA-binding CsgD family transcriptional regulator
MGPRRASSQRDCLGTECVIEHTLTPSNLIGREVELAAIGEFLGSSDAIPGALLLEGEAGIGKTTLWRSGIEAAQGAGFRVLEARPVEPESSLAFTSLGDVLGDGLGHILSSLPAPQRRSLEVALLLAEPDGHPPDRRAVGVAVLGALRALAALGPVVVALDDLHWVDAASAGALEFALRRLREEPIAVLAANRLPHPPALALSGVFEPSRVHRVEVGPMSSGAIGRMLRLRLDLILPRPVLRRVHETSGGNPLFALEIGRTLSQRSLELAPDEPLPVPEHLEALLRDRILHLPDATRSALLTCAAASRATTALVRDALGTPEVPLGPAEAAGIVAIDAGRITFAHPLYAPAVYRSATNEHRRATHGRLAEVVPDPEERARHLALAASGPSEDLAHALDAAAKRAYERGAPAAAAELMELARRSTPAEDGDSTRDRGLQAAEFWFQAGDAATARRLVQEMRGTERPGPQRARLSFLLADFSWNDVHEIWPLLDSVLEEATADTLLAEAEADYAVLQFIGGDVRAGAEHGRRAIALAERAGAPESHAVALTSTAFVEFSLGLDVSGLLSRAAEVECDIEGRRSMSSLLSAASITLGMQRMVAGDLTGGRRILERHYRDMVEQGQHTVLWECLLYLSWLEGRAGAFERALELAEELLEVLDDSGYDQARDQGLWARAQAEAHLGLVEQARRDATEGLELSERHGDLSSVILNGSVLGFLELSLGDVEAAIRSMERLPDLLGPRGIVEPCLYAFVPDYVEALVGTGQLGRAQEALEPFEHWGIELDRPLALATSARCRGLIAAGDQPAVALVHLGRALELHERLDHHPFELARTKLVMGTVQRRVRQTRNARASLAAALATFQELGTPLWADRATAELARVGGRTPAGDELTPSERRIAELVAEGMTNREVAAILVVSQRTVESALTHVYRKLAVRSRTELALRLTESD